MSAEIYPKQSCQIKMVCQNQETIWLVIRFFSLVKGIVRCLWLVIRCFSLVWFIDFEKAFDSLDWDFMLKCLDAFGFGPSLKRWVETFYKNISSCVINNGICTPYFEVQRGVRQGDPLSPYLHVFIIAAELLAITMRSRTDIQGLKIGREEFKMVQHADDLTLFVPDLECAQRIFHLFDQFEACSGLKVNYTKTEAIWIGSSRNNTEAPLGLKWVSWFQGLQTLFQSNNLSKTQQNVALLKEFLTLKNDSRLTEEIPPKELNAYISEFIITVRKKDNNEDYEPSSLCSLLARRIQHFCQKP